MSSTERSSTAAESQAPAQSGSVPGQTQDTASALAAARDSYRQLFENAPVGYVVLCRSGVIRQANQAAGAMLGLASQQLEGQSFYHWLHPCSHPALDDLDQRRTRPSVTVDLQLQRADGQTCSAQAQLVATEDLDTASEQDEPRLLMALTDITALKRAQGELLRLNQTLEERIEQRTADVVGMAGEMERFTQSVAHDLSGPLRHIQSFAGRLERSDLSEADRRAVSTILASAGRMNTLIDALDQVALACNSQLSLMPIDLDRVLDAALKSSGAAQRMTICRSDLPQVLCDIQSMQTVLAQLLDNAAKATAGSAEPSLDISAERRGNEVIIHLRDNGMGFNANYRAHIFEVFRKLHPDRDFPGEGVGLSVVRRLMLRQGGRVWADSAGAGEGACFSLALPAAP
ncbi:sensor histidine kinase [Deinococcus sp. Marseille-Q6407]|uniref:sensor histidine kinase n=1 Tax=Deinococcus sp. Marseille-Q6407 TaxID=2969223 RepID=UPI0021BFD295|nr:PAS domain-containing sensor histidine kinase [Deinococcus sp. Marseille-Q6407]